MKITSIMCRLFCSLTVAALLTQPLQAAGGFGNQDANQLLMDVLEGVGSGSTTRAKHGRTVKTDTLSTPALQMPTFAPQVQAQEESGDKKAEYQPSRLEKTYKKLIDLYLPELLREEKSLETFNQPGRGAREKKSDIITAFFEDLMRIDQLVARGKIPNGRVMDAIEEFLNEMPETESEEANMLPEGLPEEIGKQMEILIEKEKNNLRISNLITTLLEKRDLLSLAHLERLVKEFNSAVGSAGQNYAKENGKEKRETGGIDSLQEQSEDEFPIRQYGYNLFNSTAVYSDNFQGVIDDSYIIGPGDSFLINLWGSVDDSYQIEVLREGVLPLPPIGKLQVGGLNYKEAKEMVNSRIRAYYKNTPPSTSITLGEIRGITVYVTGEVKHPGRYNVSARHTVMSLLFMARGVKKAGSLRSITVRRKNGQTYNFDTYQALIKGDPSADTTLLDGDIIHVPPIGKTVAIAGELIRPGIYEILGDETIEQAVNFVGGFAPMARKNIIAVVKENSDGTGRSLVDIAKDKWATNSVENGSIIAARSMADIDNNIITIKGAVYFPGSYAWHQGASLQELISKAGGLTPKAYSRYGIVKRQNGAAKDYRQGELLGQVVKRSTISFKVGDVVQGSKQIPLKAMDEVVIYSRKELQSPATVNIIGEIKNPGTYEYSNGMQLIDLIVMGGGLSPDASFEKAVLTRIERVNNQRNISKHVIDLRTLLKGENNMLLQPGDELVISKSRINFIHVNISGEVNLPGTYRMKSSDRISDLLMRANGFTEKADPRGTIFNREQVKAKTKIEFRNMADRLERNMLLAMADFIGSHAGENMSQGIDAFLRFQQRIVAKAKDVKPTGRIILKMPKDMSRFKESLANIELEDGDTIHIPATIKSINITGEVTNPSTSVWRPNAVLSDYLTFAGGTTRFADMKGVYVIRNSGEILTAANYRQTLGMPVVKGDSREQRDTLMKHFKNYRNSDEFAEIPIECGDTIYVPQKTEIKFSKVYIMRAVLSDALRVATFAKILTDL